MYVMYANPFPSQFEPLFGLPVRHPFCGILLKPFKNWQHAFYRNKNTGLSLVFFYSDKALLVVF